MLMKRARHQERERGAPRGKGRVNRLLLRKMDVSAPIDGDEYNEAVTSIETKKVKKWEDYAPSDALPIQTDHSSPKTDRYLARWTAFNELHLRPNAHQPLGSFLMYRLLQLGTSVSSSTPLVSRPRILLLLRLHRNRGSSL